MDTRYSSSVCLCLLIVGSGVHWVGIPLVKRSIVNKVTNNALGGVIEYRDDRESMRHDLNKGHNYQNQTILGGPRLLINQPHLCTAIKSMKYIVYVHSAPPNFERREALRQTWMSEDVFQDRIIGRVFVLGKTSNAVIQRAIEIESWIYQDIIQGNFLDAYWNLTTKNIMALGWVTKFCKQAEYVIKTDDDIFANIYGIVYALQNYAHKGHTIFGYCETNGHPERDLENKWYMSKSEYPASTYPTYCIGGISVMTRDLVPELYRWSLSTPPFRIDDVFVTGILASKVKNVHHIGFKKDWSVKCWEVYDDLQQVNTTFLHTIAECREMEEFMAMWRLYEKRAHSHIHLLKEGVLNATYTFPTDPWLAD